MKIKKNIFKGAILGITLMTIMSARLTIAEANNYGDTTFAGYYLGYNIVNTGYRAKEDDSYAYIYNLGSPCAVYVSVWGASGRFDGKTFYKYDGQEGCCDLYGNQALVGKGKSAKLINHVYEKGYNAAALRITGTQSNVTLSGLWSPDSI